MERAVGIGYLQNIMGSNKAMGLVAQADFQKWVHESGGSAERKYFNGCWVMSPKGSTATKRMCFFVHNKIETKETLLSAVDSLISNRGFHSLCGSMTRSGFGVFHCFAKGSSSVRNLADLDWSVFRYQNENLIEMDAQQFFANWPGRGRPGRGVAWNANVIDRYQVLDIHMLESLVLNQVFFNSFVKELMRKPVADPYDVDGFFVSYEGKILPLEIKEKFPFEANKVKLLGIDAGRILMLMRICLPLDCNGLYLIREVEDSPQRRFVGWKMTTLDSIVMNSNWTLQAGGMGMTGGPTQTVTFPYACFSDVNVQTFSDENLHRMSEFSKVIKEKAAAFQSEVEKFVDSVRPQSQGRLSA